MNGLAFAIGALVIVAWAGLHAGLEEKLMLWLERRADR